MTYRNFILHIGRDRGGGYEIQVESPAGEGEGIFVPPENFGPLEAVLAKGAWQEVGHRLFQALFQGEVRRRWDESLGLVAGTGSQGLRLQLKLDLEHPDLARLHALPWELLYDAEKRDFFGLQLSTPLVRYLEVPRSPGPPPLPSTLRILAVAAHPHGLARLDLECEYLALKSALAESQAPAHVEILTEPTLPTLRKRLRDGGFHVLHFMGHGKFDEATGQGALYFPDPAGIPALIHGAKLAIHLRGIPSLRLVVLNACETARTSDPGGLNPFAGVASSLVQVGLPAVVAMQAPITDKAALTFSRTLYQRISAGDPVDVATLEGRLALHEHGEITAEWSIPVLFLRRSDGQLFLTRASASPPASWRERKLAVAAILTLGLGAALVGASERFLPWGLRVFPLSPDSLEDLAEHLRAKGYEPSVGLAGPLPGTVLQVSRRGAGGRLEPIQPPQVVLWADRCFPGKTPRPVFFSLPDRLGSRKGGLKEEGALPLFPELCLRSAKSWEFSVANPHLLTFAKLELSQHFSPECLDHLQAAFDSGEEPAEYATVYEAVVADGMTLSIDWQAGAEGEGKAALERAARKAGKGVKVQMSAEAGEKTRLKIEGPLVLGYRTASMEPKRERPAPPAGGKSS